VLSRSCTYQPGRYTATFAMMASARPGTISSSRLASLRIAITMAAAASATPARCSTLNTMFTGWPRPNRAPNSSSSPWPVRNALYSSRVPPSRVVETGCRVNPPQALIRAWISAAAATAASEATMREGSYHQGGSGAGEPGTTGRSDGWRGAWRARTCCKVRSPHTATSGTTPMTSVSGSATSPQVSSSPAAAGPYQRGPQRSMASQASSTGMALVKWSGVSSSVYVASPGAGASMIPAPISARVSPCVPVARPLATSPASSTAIA